MQFPKEIVEVVKIDENAVIPSKAHSSDSGFDITILSVAKELSPKTKLYHTGLKFSPKSSDIYLELYARSSLMKFGYMLANSVGIVDNGYIGELLVALYKFDDSLPDLTFPFKCAQIIPRRSVGCEMKLVNELKQTERNAGGFGSTGN